jgi:AraC-like DNA-binding protein
MAYRELLLRAPDVACAWLRDAEPEAREHRVLPDACVDVVWIADRTLVVAGPATGPVNSHVPAGAGVMGVRFRIGAAGAALGLPARELLDARVALEDVWGREATFIAERIAAAATPTAQLAALARALRARHPAEPDPIVRAAALGAADPGARVERLAATLGVGDRQLRRRFAAAVGYGPKILHRILRFQRFLALAAEEGPNVGPDSTAARRTGAATAAEEGPIVGADSTAARGRFVGAADLARLALDAGYADQAHLTRECRRLAGLTPVQLLASGAGPAGDRSVSFKTPALPVATMAA